MEHVEQWSLPIARGDNYFFEKRLAGEDQSSIYVRRGWAGKDARLIDPAQSSAEAFAAQQALRLSGSIAQ